VQAVVPRWTTPTFLVYAGGLTLFFAASLFLTYEADRHSHGVFTLITFLLVALCAALVSGTLRRGLRITAGVLAFVDVFLWAIFVGTAWDWFGWLDLNSTNGPFAGFHVGQLTWELLWIAGAAAAVRLVRHPFPLAQVVLVTWLFVTDLVSGGGTWSAVVTILIGVAYTVWGVTADTTGNRAYGFWPHLGAGLTIGGALIYLLHHGKWEWFVIALGGVGYVYLASVFRRSSWAVLGAIGIFLAAGYWSYSLTHFGFSLFGDEESGYGARPWAPSVVFLVAGAVMIALGLAVSRYRRSGEPVTQVGDDLT
jgi:hypothetical protein